MPSELETILLDGKQGTYVATDEVELLLIIYHQRIELTEDLQE